MEPKETITISKEEYDQLRKDSDFLAALHSAGVDNWEGYSEACDEDDGESEEDIYGPASDIGQD